MLRGGEVVTVDEKGRMKIPARFLDRFKAVSADDSRIMTTSLDGKTIWVFPLPAWEELESRLVGLASTDEAVESFAQTVNYWGRESQLDAQGRVLIHPLLRESAGVNGSVHVSWSRNHLEIVDHAKLAANPPTVSREHRARLTDLGI
ncbi:MAG: division/cell wall cluster transcriptional repressor MraZ [Acidobacteriota bacterium]